MWFEKLKDVHADFQKFVDEVLGAGLILKFSFLSIPVFLEIAD
jgi:hypothetical protein